MLITLSSSSLDLDVKSPLATEVFNMARYHIPNKWGLNLVSDFNAFFSHKDEIEGAKGSSWTDGLQGYGKVKSLLLSHKLNVDRTHMQEKTLNNTQRDIASQKVLSTSTNPCTLPFYKYVLIYVSYHIE